VWWKRTVIPTTQEAEIRRIMVQGQPEKNISKTPISTNKPDTAAHICSISYLGGISRRILVQVKSDKNCETLSKKGLGE
jgi:hypothetical protein